MPISVSHASSLSSTQSAEHWRSEQPVSALDMPVTALAGVGSKVAEQLAQLSIVRIFDLLLHLPRDYEDRSRLVSIADVRHGQAALITGRVVHVDVKRSGMTVIIDDDTGPISLRFFKVYRGLAQTMSLGTQLQLFGEVKVSRYGKQMHHPEYQVITDNSAMTNTGLQPIYPSVKGLHQNKLRMTRNRQRCCSSGAAASRRLMSLLRSVLDPTQLTHRLNPPHSSLALYWWNPKVGLRWLLRGGIDQSLNWSPPPLYRIEPPWLIQSSMNLLWQPRPTMGTRMQRSTLRR